MRALTTCALLGLLLAVSCSGYFGPQRRAAEYYAFMVGRTPKAHYSSFISPAYRKKLGTEGQRALDEALSKAKRSGERYPRAGVDDIGVESKGRFAWTSVNPLLGDAYAHLEPVRWVKVGLGWYLYFGSDAEQEAYGDFPYDLGKPLPPRRIPTPTRIEDPDEAPAPGPAPRSKPPPDR